MSIKEYISKIGILDTSISSLNLCDYIIMDAARKTLSEVLPNQQHVSFSTHDSMGRVGFKRQKFIEKNILCGTNCLNSSMLLHRQWNVGITSTILMAKTVTLGVGWGRYESAPDHYTSWLLKSLICKEMLSSVRDNYTLNYLRKSGISNSILTGCPKLWPLTPSFYRNIPTGKSENVVFTLTDYRSDPLSDKNLLNILYKEYDNIYFWPQGSYDLEYAISLDRDILQKVNLIPPNLKSFDMTLTSDLTLDYVGTRLHAGIRAMQKERRAIVIGVDNRAIEKQKDFNVTVIKRSHIVSDLQDMIRKTFATEITLPSKNIEIWKRQFN